MVSLLMVLMALGPMPSPSLKTDSTTLSSVAVVSRPAFPLAIFLLFNLYASASASIIVVTVMPRDGTCAGHEHTSNSHPVVNNHTGTDDGRTSVDTTSDEGHLEQTRELVLVLYRRLRVDDTALVRKRHVGARKDVVGDGLAENLHAEHICYSAVTPSVISPGYTKQDRTMAGPGIGIGM